MLKRILVATLIVVVIASLNSTPGHAQTPDGPYLIITAAEVNVRVGPGTNYDSFRTIYNDGTTYPIIGRHGSWWLITVFAGWPGWVNAAYAKVTGANRVPQIGTCAFRTHIAPDCPRTRDIVKITYQPFEHGFMVIYGSGIMVMWQRPDQCLQSSGTCRAENFPDTWSGQTLPSVTPPAGLQQPQYGFGKLWLDQNMQQRLGWATAGETTYTTPLETNYLPHSWDFFCLPNGKIVQRHGSYFAGLLWVYVKGSSSACRTK